MVICGGTPDRTDRAATCPAPILNRLQSCEVVDRRGARPEQSGGVHTAEREDLSLLGSTRIVPGLTLPPQGMCCLLGGVVEGM